MRAYLVKLTKQGNHGGPALPANITLFLKSCPRESPSTTSVEPLEAAYGQGTLRSWDMIAGLSARKSFNKSSSHES